MHVAVVLRHRALCCLFSIVFAFGCYSPDLYHFLCAFHFCLLLSAFLLLHSTSHVLFLFSVFNILLGERRVSMQTLSPVRTQSFLIPSGAHRDSPGIAGMTPHGISL